MAQLMSVRSNQTFHVDYESNQLAPQTEMILLIEKPHYKIKGKDIVKSSELQEVRFETGTTGLAHLIGMLEGALKVAQDYEKLGGTINNMIVSDKTDKTAQ